MLKPLWGVASVIAFVSICLLIWRPPVASSDWAAWMQAFGSVFAVGAAVWIGHAQDRERRCRALLMFGQFHGRLMGACAEIRDAFTTENMDRYRKAVPRLHDLTEWGKTIEAQMLDDAHLDALLTIRGYAAEAAEHATKSGPIYNSQHEAGYFEGIRQRLHEVGERLFKTRG